MADREWLPTEYMDELVPPLRATPSDWIMKLDDGTYALHPCDGDTGDGLRVLLKDGDVIEFDWRVILGSADITIDEGDGWQSAEDTISAPPEGSTLCVWQPGNPESMALSLREFVGQWRKAGEGGGKQVTIEFYCWTDAPVQFAFYAGAFVDMSTSTSMTAGVS